MNLMVTGHRQIVPPGLSGSPWPENPQVRNHHLLLMNKLTKICNQMFDLGYDTFISGMALGADQLFAKAVVDLKDVWKRPVRLVAAVPFEGQEGKWPAKSQEAYRKILAKCDHVQVICPGAYAPQKMQIRNRWMVDNSEATLAVWSGIKSGGTWNCLEYARERGKLILRIHPETLEFFNG